MAVWHASGEGDREYDSQCGPLYALQSILKFTSYRFFFSARLSVKHIHCVCEYTSMCSSDKLHGHEFSIPVRVVTLQGAICLHCLQTLDSF